MVIAWLKSVSVIDGKMLSLLCNVLYKLEKAVVLIISQGGALHQPKLGVVSPGLSSKLRALQDVVSKLSMFTGLPGSPCSTLHLPELIVVLTDPSRTLIWDTYYYYCRVPPLSSHLTER